MYVKNNLTFDETCSRMFAKVCVSLWLLRLLELPAVRSSRKESKDDRPAIDFIYIGEKNQAHNVFIHCYFYPFYIISSMTEASKYVISQWQ